MISINKGSISYEKETNLVVNVVVSKVQSMVKDEQMALWRYVWRISTVLI